MNINRSIFRQYDIRGRVDIDLNLNSSTRWDKLSGQRLSGVAAV